MKPFALMIVGAGLIYLAITGKAGRTLKATFGK